MSGEVVEPLLSINPADGMCIGAYRAASPHSVVGQIERSAAAQQIWRGRAVDDRVAALQRVARSLRHNADVLARLATAEMGKPIASARAEVEKCAACCEWYASHAHLLQPTPGPRAGDEIRIDALGLLFAIMPWNFPYWQVVRVLAPALLIGNAVVLKHAENVTGCALLLRDTVRAALGSDADVFDVLVIHRDLAAAVIASPQVAAVTVTGSERAGAAVAAAAGAALKPVVLELGGSDPFIVWADVDVSAAARAAAMARCVNSGQSCIAGKRFLIHDAIYDTFVPAFIDAMRAFQVGDPRELSTEVGPLVSAAARDTLHTQVRATLDAGAVARLGCAIPDGIGAFYPPSIVTDIPDNSPLASDEVFGPVAGVWRVRDLDDATARANSTRFGLGASVWTQDADVAAHFTAQLHAGTVMMNQPVVSDAALPFGGVKASGFGRELGLAGVLAFANIKTVRGAFF